MSDHDDDHMTDGEFASVLQRVADAFDHDLEPIPANLMLAAQEAFTWRLDGADLAELLFDSTADELIGVRGSTTDRRSFRYAAGEHVVRVHLTPATMIVMIEPPLSVTCRVTTEDGRVDHRTDEFGELVVDAPELPVRVEVDLPSGTTVTPWITG